MKKIITVGFNVFIYANLFIALATFGYANLPEQYQVLSGIGLDTLFVGGSATTLIGVAGMWYKQISNKQFTETQTEIIKMTEIVVDLLEQNKVVARNEALRVQETVALRNEITSLKKMVKADLEVKASSPLINDIAKQVIEGVLNEH
jgi:hypothetical protein